MVLSWVFEYLIHAMFCDTSWDWVLQMDLDDYLCWIFWIFPSICCANSKWRKISFDYFDLQQDPHQDFSCQNHRLFSDGSNLSRFSWQLRVGQKDRYLYIKRRIKIMKKQYISLLCFICFKKFEVTKDFFSLFWSQQDPHRDLSSQNCYLFSD